MTSVRLCSYGINYERVTRCLCHSRVRFQVHSRVVRGHWNELGSRREQLSINDWSQL